MRPYLVSSYLFSFGTVSRHVVSCVGMERGADAASVPALSTRSFLWTRTPEYKEG